MSRSVVDSRLIRDHFDLVVLPIQFTANLHEVGRNHWAKMIRLLGFTLRLLYLGLIHRPELVYFTLVPIGMPFYRDFMLLSLIKAMGLRAVLHLHGIGVKESARRRINRVLHRRTFSGVEIIHLSPLLHEDIAAYIPRERCHFLANGIPSPPAMGDTLPPPLEKRENSVRFLFLSNITEEKGPLDFVRALGILRDRGRSFHATIAGAVISHDCLNRLERLIGELHLENRVVYVGPKYDQEKAALFFRSDIFVLPTHRESFPLVLLEAMSHGLPTIAPVEGAIPAIIEDGVTGILYQKKDVENLAQAMESLEMNHDLRHSMGKAGKKRFQEHFTLEVFEARLERILSTCLQR
ncbi:MAG: glycosyltransferase [Magnetococcales bacterium]|nr:glycosyltransferase [Magnetococcales bacterium]